MRTRGLLLSNLFVLSMVSIILSPYQAEAVPFTLTLDDTAGNVVSVVDGGVGDMNPLEGAITYIGSVGTNWFVNVSTGLSQPLVGDPPHYAQMDFSSVNVSRGPGTLLLAIVDDWDELNGQEEFGLTLTNEFGGTFHGTADAVGTLVEEGGTEWTVANLTLGPGADSDTETIWIPGFIGGFELRELVTIVHTGGGTSSFDKEITAAPVPEPGTLFLLGAGLIGMATLGRKKWAGSK